MDDVIDGLRIIAALAVMFHPFALDKDRALPRQPIRPSQILLGFRPSPWQLRRSGFSIVVVGRTDPQTGPVGVVNAGVEAARAEETSTPTHTRLHADPFRCRCRQGDMDTRVGSHCR